MYKSNRARLSSAITLSPWETAKRNAGENFIATLFSVGMVFVWMGFLFLISQIIVLFGGRHFLKYWDEEEGLVNAAYVFSQPWMEMVKIIGGILVSILIYRKIRKKELKR